jgi:hypothetical protein
LFVNNSEFLYIISKTIIYTHCSILVKCEEKKVASALAQARQNSQISLIRTSGKMARPLLPPYTYKAATLQLEGAKCGCSLQREKKATPEKRDAGTLKISIVFK